MLGAGQAALFSVRVTLMPAVTVAPVFRLDRDEFASGFARRPVAVDHTLADDPLLSLEEIANLADRFPGRVERHSADLPMVMPGGAPLLELSPSEMVRGIEHNRCWMVFWYVDQDPAYKALLDRCLDQAESFLPSGAGPPCSARPSCSCRRRMRSPRSTSIPSTTSCSRSAGTRT